MLRSLQETSAIIDSEEYIKAEQDTFLLRRPESIWSMTSLTRAAVDIATSVASSDEQDHRAQAAKNMDGTAEDANDYSQIVKTLVAHDNGIPRSDTTPYFNLERYYEALLHYRQLTHTSSDPHFGSPLLYGEVVTSTSTLLEKNPILASHLPPGTTFTATTQVSGRGRGSNVWVSPPGALMFSTKFSHPLALNATAPVVFVQYLAAMAVVEAVKTYDSNNKRYAELPVRLKWPNDIYALDTPYMSSAEKPPERDHFVKIGGILVNTSYSGGDYHVILGIGLNLSNAAPTTSLNALIETYNSIHTSDAPLAPLSNERLLARILTTFGNLYAQFKLNGFAGALERQYYENWLHSNQVVTLETEGGAKAQIKGISTDWGLLIAEEYSEKSNEASVNGATNTLDGTANSTGMGSLSGSHLKRFALQSDSNSFDFFKGLVKSKL